MNRIVFFAINEAKGKTFLNGWCLQSKNARLQIVLFHIPILHKICRYENTW